MSQSESSAPFSHFQITHPRFSSDTSLTLCDGQGNPVVLGVADMIGRPGGLPWHNYMRMAERQMRRRYGLARANTLDQLAEFLRDELIAHNGMIREIARRHDRSAFGFCVTFLLRHERQGRIFWLGDSRAYKIRKQYSATHPFLCEPLTRDHNGLDASVREKGEFILFRKELLELGKQIGVYLGHEPEAVRIALQTEWTDTALKTGDLLLLVTDGFYVPLLRMALDHAGDRITMDRLYLGSFLSQWFAKQPEAFEPAVPWEQWIRRLHNEVIHYTRRHKAYRDDMAINGLMIGD